MYFNLINDWDTIKHARHNLDWFDSKWIHNWTSNQDNASVMFEAIKLMKPRVIIETGTFEGHGTFLIAKALHEIGLTGTIYTIDYDGDPLTKLEEEEWTKLKEIRDANLAAVRQKFPEIEIQFINGDSRVVLPKLMREKNITWDLFYQDSMHFYTGVKAEWDAVKEYASENAVAIFDDISVSKTEFEQDGYRFCSEFINSEETNHWTYKNTDIGHHQFWVQKKIA